MSKVLVYTTPARGHLYPIMATALELARRGHDVCVRTLAAELDVVRAAGLRAEAIDARIEARVVDDFHVRSPLESARRGVKTFVDRAAFEVDDMRAAIAAEQPGVLLVDTNAWGAQAVAEASGLPWATWHPFPLPYPSRDAPPFGPGLAPATNALGRLRDRLLAPVVLGPFQKYLPALNEVRAQAGAPALAHILELFLRPPLMLNMTAEPFEYRRSDWPANVRLVGPGLWSPPSVQAHAPIATSKPVVLVTCSTEFQDDGALITAALGAFGDDDSVQLVCTTAGVDPAAFRATAATKRDDVVVERFLPHAALLPRACVVVCHGGMGITQRALAAGVPVCVVPWGRDQLEVARRAVHAHAGTMLARNKLTPSRLRDAARAARAMTSGAAVVRDAFAAAGGAVKCADLVEALAQRNGDDGRVRTAA
jgi:MGT family glycosyltransferase